MLYIFDVIKRGNVSRLLTLSDMKSLETAKTQLEKELKKHRDTLSKTKHWTEWTTKECNKEEKLKSALKHLELALHDLSLLG